jgi:hypothetical protein
MLSNLFLYNNFLATPNAEQFSQMKLRQTKMEKSVLDFGRKESFRDILITINFVLELIAQICSKVITSIHYVVLPLDYYLSQI